jgi:DNA-binding NarL/FixJ family response regulator
LTAGRGYQRELPYQGIAEALVITVPAVERHVTRIFVKLGLTHKAEDHLRVLAVLKYLKR